MSANTLPVFGLTPNSEPSRIAAANTARDGSGSLVTITTVGANGGKLAWVKITSAQATAAASSTMVVRIFVTDAAGANPRLVIEALLTTLTPSTVVIGSTVVIDVINGITINNATQTFNGIIGGIPLKTGQLIKACQSIYAGVQDQNDVQVGFADF
jgi:hypothetical protein